ncbi:MAG: TIGR03936 family radical SAM-associated protein [Sphingomonadaceae bacterium]
MAQRLRIGFARHGGVKYLSHLELMRMWERVLRRAGWQLTYSQGFNPHPKLSFAAALPVGVAAEAELLEIQLDESRPLGGALEDLARQLPEGIAVLGVEEIPADAPAIQRSLMAAEYRVLCSRETQEEPVRREAERILAAGSLVRERAKEGKAKRYDLRPMIRALQVEPAADGRAAVRMELRTDAQGAGRPDEVLREMGLDPADCEITRLRLILRE